MALRAAEHRAPTCVPLVQKLICEKHEITHLNKISKPERVITASTSSH